MSDTDTAGRAVSESGVAPSGNGTAPDTSNRAASHVTGAAPAPNGTRRPWYAPWRVSRDGVSAIARPLGLRGWLGARLHATGTTPADMSDNDATASGGLHEATKACDVWFSIETAQLEKDAVELAHAAAAANLPRLEVVYDEVSEEAALAARCRASGRGIHP
jgi:hypothetical protein